MKASDIPNATLDVLEGQIACDGRRPAGSMGNGRMGQPQEIYAGAIVSIAGLEFVVVDPHVENADGVDRVTFIGHMTASPRNDHLRGTEYDGARYGGNHLAYRWSSDLPRRTTPAGTPD